ncbi:hypothetical protein NQ028_13525 [Corynebacterium phoceense]|uniref:hypothetical protein n=1 Tax=Corynebacterium phoceense TaxID=1686286 RepID=UPI00211C0AE5|nr:hypothetical protein [Corynebacterium phoceense]MCQ9342130.1 hypothetical protein [Corynebacterium phoceense]
MKDTQLVGKHGFHYVLLEFPVILPDSNKLNSLLFAPDVGGHEKLTSGGHGF